MDNKYCNTIKVQYGKNNDRRFVILSPLTYVRDGLSLCDLGGATPELGTPIAIENAQDHIFGMVLMNDWSGKC